jgi:hypothetical protein
VEQGRDGHLLGGNGCRRGGAGPHGPTGLIEPSPPASRDPLLLQAGIQYTLNADDPLLFGPGLLEEYETARAAFALTDPKSPR